VDIVAYLRMLRRHWKLVVAATLLGALVGVATTLASSEAREAGRKYHKATHTLFLDISGAGEGGIRPVYTNLDQIAVLVTTGEVPDAVAGRLGGDPNEWATHIFTVTNGATNTLDIVCADRDADVAVACADAFAEALIADLGDREQTRFDSQRDETLRRLDTIQADMNALDAQIATRPPNLDVLQAQRSSLVNQYRLVYEKLQQLANQGGPGNVISTLETAESVPITKSEYDNRITRGQLGENHVRADFATTATDSAVADGSSTTSDDFSGPVARGVLGAVLGLLIGVGLAVVADRLDRRVRTREEVEAAFGMSVLAEVPALTSSQQRDATVQSVVAPLSRAAEAYRAVRSSLLFQRATDTRHAPSDDAFVILVTSAGPKEGKTTSSANLAAVFAEAGSRVLVINCDFRRPTLHRHFDLPNEARRVFESQVPGVWVITDVTSGGSDANPALILEEQRRLVASARKRFDVIIIDTAPLLTTNDATEIMDSADLTVLVCRAAVTTIDGATRARELLARIAAPVSGVVLLGSQASPNDYYYYYSRNRSKTPTADPEAAAPASGSPTDGLFVDMDPAAEIPTSEPGSAT
jgi:capsular exopolysaccharide synthesis family protein